MPTGVARPGIIKKGKKRTLMRTKTQTRPRKGNKAEIEPMATRVELHPFLIGMDSTQLTLLTDCAIPVHFEEGQIIFKQGEMANRFYLIESGKVVLESSDERRNLIVIDTIGAGDLLGWSWMFPPYTWRFTASAIEPSSAIFFYGTILREYCERDHSLGYQLFKRMAPIMIKRMQCAREKLILLKRGNSLR
jgi:CRP-like cAMP-binding protein